MQNTNEINLTVPFTYCLTHKPSGKRYYGVRWRKGCHPSDLWTKYFSSSKVIARMLYEDGIDSFDATVRRTFKTPAAARVWEEKVLRRLKVHKNEQWLNRNIHFRWGTKNSSKVRWVDTIRPEFREKYIFIDRPSLERVKTYKTNIAEKDITPEIVRFDFMKDRAAAVEKSKQMSRSPSKHHHGFKKGHKINQGRKHTKLTRYKLSLIEKTFKGMHWYYDPITDQSGRFFPDQKPSGWRRGRSRSFCDDARVYINWRWERYRQEG